MVDEFAVPRETIRRRLRILAVGVWFVALLCISRNLAIVLNYNDYSPKGVYGVVATLIILFASFQFLYVIRNNVLDASNNVWSVARALFTEWASASPMNKLLHLSGLLSLPISLETVARWITRIADYIVTLVPK